MVKILFQHTKFPAKIKTAVLEFLKNSNYTQLFTRLTRFVLSKYKVQGKVEVHVKDLINSKTFKNFTEKFSNLQFKEGGKLPSGLFAQLKTILKEKYGIPVAVMDLVDELFSKVDIKTFSLRELPVMLVSNKIPNMVKKFIIHLRKTDLSDYLFKMIETVLPGTNETLVEFLKLAEGPGSLDDLLLGTYKLIIKTLKDNLKLGESSKITINRLSEYMELLLSDEDLAKKSKKLMEDGYDRTISRLTESYPDVMKEFETLTSKIKIHIKNIDAEMMKKNTSFVLLKLFNGIFKDLTDYFDTEFRAGLRDKVSELPAFIMSRLIDNETMIKDYEARWQQVNLLYGMVTKFFDDIIRAGNGTFSIVDITKNVVTKLKSLNNTAINTLFDNLDTKKFSNLTYDVFLNGTKRFLNDIGSIKHGGKTITRYAQGFLKDFRKMMQDAYPSVKNLLKKGKENQGKAKAAIQSFFNMLRGYLQAIRGDENKYKVIKFIVDSLVPGIDGLFQFDKNQNTSDYCKKSFLMSYGIKDEVLPTHLRKKFSQYRRSLNCDLLKLKDDIKNMKKDDTFIDNLLNKMESIALKMFNENIESLDRYDKMIKSIMVETSLLADSYDKMGLGEILFDLDERIFDFLMNIEGVDRLMSLFIDGSQKITYKKVLQRYVIKYLKLVPSLLSGPVKVIDDFGNKYIFPTYLRMKSKFHNVTTILNSGKKFIIERISRFTNPKNSEGYLKLLPEALSKKIKQTFKVYQNKVVSAIYAVERQIRNGRKQLDAMSQKYRLKLREQINLIKSKINNSITNFLGYVLVSFEKYNARLNNLFQPLKNKEWDLADLKGKFVMLTKKTRKLRAKYTNIKRQFINDLRKKIWQKLSGIRCLKVKSTDALLTMLKDVDFTYLNKAVNMLDKSLRQVLKDSMIMAEPRVMKGLEMFDKKVCEGKRALLQLFPKKNGDLYLSYNLENEKLRRVANELFKKRDHVTTLKQIMVDWNIGIFKLSKVKHVLQGSFEQGFKRYFAGMVYGTRVETAFIRKALEVYANYSDVAPDLLLKQLLSKYEMEINRTMLMINKAFVMNPPALIERQMIRFLGIGYKPKTNMFQPLSRTAYLFERSLVTFDGKPIFFPQSLSENFFACKFLLSRDFLWKHFTIYIHEGKFVVELMDAKVMIDFKKRNKVILTPPGGDQAITEFPVQLSLTTVTKLQNVVKIQNKFGLVIYCQLDVFSCNVTVPGMYHNKTLGLFGTNNVENSDDLRMPDGKIALNIIDFINAFEITSNRKCSITSSSFQGKKTSNKYRCAALNMIGKWDMPSYTRVELGSQMGAFKQVCGVENYCSVSMAYKSFLKKESDISPDFKECGCSAPPRKLEFTSYFSSTKANIQITLLIKLVPEMEKARPKIKKILNQIENEFSDKLNIRFTIVGFAGNKVFNEPHIQTAFGEVTYNVDGALKAMDILKFDGVAVPEKLGISALKFAAPIHSNRGMKIFLLFENDASYTNRLPQLMDVSETLNDYGVILNVVNNYKMKTNVIAKDSHKTRYHLHLPKGEPFPKSVKFPPTDDYIPFVKQTQGAVFTLKAFTSDGSGWSKSVPISTAEILRKQIARDASRCKQCKCNTCKNIAKDDCYYGLARGRRLQ